MQPVVLIHRGLLYDKLTAGSQIVFALTVGSLCGDGNACGSVDLGNVYLAADNNVRISGGVPLAAKIKQHDGVLYSALEDSGSEVYSHFALIVFVEDIAVGSHIGEPDFVAEYGTTLDLSCVRIGVLHGADEDAVAGLQLAAVKIDNNVLALNEDDFLFGFDLAVGNCEFANLGVTTHYTVDQTKIAAALGFAAVEGDRGFACHDGSHAGYIEYGVVENIVASPVGIAAVAALGGNDFTIVGFKINKAAGCVGGQSSPAVAGDEAVVEIAVGLLNGAVGTVVAFDLEGSGRRHFGSLTGAILTIGSAVGGKNGVIYLQDTVAAGRGTGATQTGNVDKNVLQGKGSVAAYACAGALFAKTAAVTGEGDYRAFNGVVGVCAFAEDAADHAVVGNDAQILCALVFKFAAIESFDVGAIGAELAIFNINCGFHNRTGTHGRRTALIFHTHFLEPFFGSQRDVGDAFDYFGSNTTKFRHIFTSFQYL